MERHNDKINSYYYQFSKQLENIRLI